ncbi:phage major capsid protein [Streptomyces sp. NPDC091377]|uniref:phage major capsid protein n=1 Tax=Streptomyces sp. NPDC091377 TaxID=3365995 RepID=UPI003810A701
MTTINDLITAAQREKVAAQRRVSDAEAKGERVLKRSEAEGRKILTPEEERQVEEIIAEKRAAGDLVKELDGKLNALREIERDEAETTRLSALTYPTGTRAPAYDRVARVGAEARTYQPPEASRDGRGITGPSFLRDLYDHQIKHDPAAGGRLERHGREVESLDPGFMQRMTGTGAVAGFVPPQYLTDLFADFARAGRPIANLCTPVPLPETGMEVDIPRVTTPTTTSVQASEGGSIGNTDLDDTLLPAPVRTIAGYTDVSRQAIERGILVQSLIFGDLAADYNSKLDAQLVNGSGASGQHTGMLNVPGINAITYTDASPTIPELWPKLADAAGKVMGQRFTGPTAFAMRSDLWAWILAEKDTVGRPLVEPGTVAVNPIAVASTRPVDYTVTAVGSLFGIPVVLDNNIPNTLGAGSNETRVIAADFRDLILMEDEAAAPVQLRFDDVQSATLQVRLLAYGYSSFAAGRQPKAISVIGGTGLIVPAL